MTAWAEYGAESLLFCAVAAAACWAIARSPRVTWSVRLAGFGIALPVCLALIGWTPPEASIPEQGVPWKTDDQGFVSSDKCRSCHPSQYASWHDTYHRTMTQAANLDIIAAPLEATAVEGRGRRFEIRLEDGVLVADDIDQFRAIEYLQKNGGPLPADFPRVTGEIVMTTGSHHMQIYWIRGEQGRLRQLSWVWLIRDQRWVPGEAVYLQPPDGRGGIAALWAKNCIKCHSVGGQPGPTPRGRDSGHPDPRIGELGIACEACHGPAQEHVRVDQNPLRRYSQYLTDADDPSIVNPSKLNQQLSMDVCGRCHSGHKQRSWHPVNGSAFRAGDRLEDHVALRRFSTMRRKRRSGFFWNDGTSRVTGREYTALIESGCFTRGDITCLSCHAMHGGDPDDQLASGREGDGACTQCHESFAARIEEHTHHASASSGARCLNCHMPNTTYGLLSLTRSHKIDSPKVETNKRSDRPNACNLCHVDRTLAWTSEWMSTWYGQSPATLNESERNIPAGARWLLAGDAVQRATAAWHLGWAPSFESADPAWRAGLLIESLTDPYAAVRYLAERSLRRLPQYSEFTYDFYESPTGKPPVFDSLGPQASRDTDLVPEWFDPLRAQRIDRPITILE